MGRAVAFPNLQQSIRLAERVISASSVDFAALIDAFYQ